MSARATKQGAQVIDLQAYRAAAKGRPRAQRKAAERAVKRTVALVGEAIIQGAL